MTPAQKNLLVWMLMMFLMAMTNLARHSVKFTGIVGAWASIIFGTATLAAALYVLISFFWSKA